MEWRDKLSHMSMSSQTGYLKQILKSVIVWLKFFPWSLTFYNYSVFQEVPDFTSQFISKDILDSKPLKGLRVGVIRETLDEGVDAEIVLSIRAAVSHLEELGCIVTEVLFLMVCFNQSANFLP